MVTDTRKMAAVPLGFMGSKVVLGCLIGFWGVWKLGQHLGICDVIFEPFQAVFVGWCGVAHCHAAGRIMPPQGLQKSLDLLYF